MLRNSELFGLFEVRDALDDDAWDIYALAHDLTDEQIDRMIEEELEREMASRSALEAAALKVRQQRKPAKSESPFRRRLKERLARQRFDKLWDEYNDERGAGLKKLDA